MRLSIPNLFFAGLLPWMVFGMRGLRLLRCFRSFKVHPDTRPVVNASQLEYRVLQPSDAWARDFQMPGCVNYVAANPSAVKGENVVASLGFGVVSRPGYGEWVYIDDVEVREDWRRKGVATQLIKRLLAYIHKGWPDVDGAFLFVLERDASIKGLYEKIGFRHVKDVVLISEGIQVPAYGYLYYFNSSASAAAVASLPRRPPPSWMRLTAVHHPLLDQLSNALFPSDGK
ncbi:hypothetical protein FOZ63_017314 [Perkinsus olseni]|uniref:N-acetyltransferase domain-containing protein n=2 Tax=Perkinsus olseni TaxID=32597 RepID=A0A7J6QPW9_PEROL|nr:hypothetical protein FOZ63_017314 [Perkinsus olseni]